MPQRSIATKAAAFLAVGLGLGHVMSTGSATQAGQPAGPLPARMAVCASCHGADGNAPLAEVPSLAGQPRVFLENQLVIIREGLRDIPQMRGMLDGASDDELVAMARHYAASPLKASPGKPQEALVERGRALSREMHCGSCHLSDYAGREQIPRLSGQREDYLLHSMRQFRNNEAKGRDTIMAASLHGTTDADLRALAHYLARVGVR
jgi:cytochrome c553